MPGHGWPACLPAGPAGEACRFGCRFSPGYPGSHTGSPPTQLLKLIKVALLATGDKIEAGQLIDAQHSVKQVERRSLRRLSVVPPTRDH